MRSVIIQDINVGILQYRVLVGGSNWISLVEVFSRDDECLFVITGYYWVRLIVARRGSESEVRRQMTVYRGIEEQFFDKYALNVQECTTSPVDEKC